MWVADNTYALSGDPRSLQGLIDIIGHYGKRYRLVFGADKTKVTITGSKHDIKYYEDINIWSLYGDKLEVSENNDHDEEIKNVDKNINSAEILCLASLATYLPISVNSPQLYNAMSGKPLSNLSSDLAWLLCQ